MLVLLVASALALTLNGKPIGAQGEEVTIEIINPISGDNEFNFSSTDHGVNSTFTADFYIVNATGIVGWQIYISWNNTVINFQKVWIPDDNVLAQAIDQGATLFAPQPSLEIDNGTGYLTYGATVFPLTPVNVTAQAFLCKINFTIAAAPEDSQILSNIEMIRQRQGSSSLDSYVLFKNTVGSGTHTGPVFAEPAEVRIVKPAVSAGATIYIRANGSVDPSTASIKRNGDIYTLTGNIISDTNGIVVERDNIIIDGAGHTFQGTGGTGIDLSHRSNITMRNMEIKMYNTGMFDSGIFLNYSSNDSISGNIITADYGIVFSSNCINDSISGNDLTNDGYGIALWSSSSNNSIFGNKIMNTYYCIAVGSSCSNNSIFGNNITNSGYCIGLWPSSSSNSVFANSIASNSGYGIRLASSSDNSIFGNNITKNYEGISVGSDCSSNSIFGNNITENYEGIYYDYGVYLGPVFGNRFYQNNIMNNTHQVLFDTSTAPGRAGPMDAWDDGFPSDGNYWSDYAGVDIKNGPYQNETGSDGIGDTAYVIDVNNTDRYPLMGMFSDFHVAQGLHVQAMSNSTISNFQFNGTAIRFNVSGENGATGFCRICVPTALLNGTLSVFINRTEIQYSLLPISNGTLSYLYFTYTHSTEEVMIMPEFPSFLMLSPENNMYNVSNIPLNFTVDIPASWIGYSLDGGANTTIAGNITLTLPEGFHNVVIYANSTAGNMGASSRVYFTIDVTPPEIVKASQNPPKENVQANQEVTISVNVTDPVSGVRSVTLKYSWGTLSLDFPMTFDPNTNLYEYTIPGQEAGTIVNFTITAYDRAGNNVMDDNAGQYYVYNVMPEFQSLIVLALFIISSLLTVIAFRRKHILWLHTLFIC